MHTPEDTQGPWHAVMVLAARPPAKSGDDDGRVVRTQAGSFALCVVEVRIPTSVTVHEPLLVPSRADESGETCWRLTGDRLVLGRDKGVGVLVRQYPAEGCLILLA